MATSAVPLPQLPQGQNDDEQWTRNDNFAGGPKMRMVARAQATGVPLYIPPNAPMPISPDLENRVHNASTVAPPPPLSARLHDDWETFLTKGRMAAAQAMGKPYVPPQQAQAPVDSNFYRPGYDAASRY